jgi:3-hydroxyacyl-CoA dehydrogenase/enoyl-CoA hydratase/3-hydroxybutyryl-CoA epimerase
MADGLERPERVVGLHFFNPVHRMPLVEVVRAERTSPTALATAFDLAVRLGKTPVVVEDRPGFLVNRLLGPYLNEAGRLLEEGAGIREIDAALVAFGMPMGPCRLLDEIGFDVALHAGHEMASGLGERLSPPDVLQRMVDDGRLGRKNGRGFYRYENGRERGPAPEADALFPRREDGPDAEACRQRCLWLMLNEACHALEERVVASAGLLDLAMIFGTGFPPFRGGLLRWADGIGATALFEGLGKLEAAHGPRFAPAPLLRRAAERGIGLSDST